MVECVVNFMTGLGRVLQPQNYQGGGVTQECIFFCQKEIVFRKVLMFARSGIFFFWLIWENKLVYGENYE